MNSEVSNINKMVFFIKRVIECCCELVFLWGGMEFIKGIVSIFIFVFIYLVSISYIYIVC